MIDWDDDYDDEAQLIEAIKGRLLTDGHRKWLFDHDLDVADLLNGRWWMGLEAEVEEIFDSWNATIGRKVFHA